MYGVHHELYTPGDAAGVATGKRTHEPLAVTKAIDQSTVPLITACMTNETLTDVTLNFWAQGENGASKPCYSTKLTNAFISNITTDMQLNKTEPGHTPPVLEYVTFRYKKIEWTFADGGLTAADNWMSNV